MPNGKVDIRFNPTTKKVRLRFHGVAEDQLELILLALKGVREEMQTEYDSVALEGLALNYLGNPKPQAPTPQT